MLEYVNNSFTDNKMSVIIKILYTFYHNILCGNLSIQLIHATNPVIYINRYLSLFSMPDKEGEL